MIEQVVGRVVSGALWGVGAGLVWRVVGGNQKDGEHTKGSVPLVRPVAKTAMKGVIVASDRMRGVFSEARETIEDIYAEAQSETVTASPAATQTRAPSENSERGNIPLEA